MILLLFLIGNVLVFVQGGFIYFVLVELRKGEEL